MNQTYEQAVEKTVEFWIEKSFRTMFNQNNGDTSARGALLFAMANKLSHTAQKSVTEKEIEAFKKSLKEKLMTLEKEHPFHRTIGVDYDPDKILAEAATESAIDSSCFPCKTWTRIEGDNTVTASYQYGCVPFKL